MYKNIFLALILLFFSSRTSSQQLILKGKVIDKPTSSPLSFASLRISGTTSGTTTNFEGNFELRLKPGDYKLIASFIGYKSDTVEVNLIANRTISFSLEPIPVHLSEITVFPGENPALEIIRRAIEAKHERNNKLNSYVFSAYTKGLVKTTKDFSRTNNSVGFSIASKDTAQLKISGIIENESKGYFKKPNQYKDEIVARKQSANTPSSVNILTGGRIIQNFYTDDIQFLGRPLPSPISDDAINYYDFMIEDTLAMDKQNVFQIHVEPLRKSDPGFVGKIFIADNIYSLVKLDVG
ncbi:MAG: carboxypeptidase-like regulatory domain-containing protein, partial [Melioribacteraceae bacterium]